MINFFAANTADNTLTFNAELLHRRYDTLSKITGITDQSIQDRLNTEIAQSFQESLRSLPANYCLDALIHLDTTLDTLSAQIKSTRITENYPTTSPIDLVLIGVQSLLHSIHAQITTIPTDSRAFDAQQMTTTRFNGLEPSDSHESKPETQKSEFTLSTWKPKTLLQVSESSTPKNNLPYSHIRKSVGQDFGKKNHKTALNLPRALYIFAPQKGVPIVGESMKKISLSELIDAIKNSPGANLILLDELWKHSTGEDVAPKKFLLGEGGLNRVFLLRKLGNAEKPEYYAVRQSTIASPSNNTTPSSNADSSVQGATSDKTKLAESKRALPKSTTTMIHSSSGVITSAVGPFYDQSSKARNAKLKQHEAALSSQALKDNLRQTAAQRPDILSVNPLALGTGKDIIGTALDSQDSVLFAHVYNEQCRETLQILNTLLTGTDSTEKFENNPQWSQNLALLSSLVKTSSIQLSLWSTSQMINAVATLHESGLGHSDIKPINFLGEADKNGLVMKLADVDDIAPYSNTRPAFTADCHPPDPTEGERITIQANDVYGCIDIAITQLQGISQFIKNTNMAVTNKYHSAKYIEKNKAEKKKSQHISTITSEQKKIETARLQSLSPQQFLEIETKASENIQEERKAIEAIEREIKNIEEKYSRKQKAQTPQILDLNHKDDETSSNLENRDETKVIKQINNAIKHLHEIKTNTTWTEQNPTTKTLEALSSTERQQELNQILQEVQETLAKVQSTLNMKNYSSKNALEHQLISAAVLTLLSPDHALCRSKGNRQKHEQIHNLSIERFAPSLIMTFSKLSPPSEPTTNTGTTSETMEHFYLSPDVHQCTAARSEFLRDIILDNSDSDSDSDSESESESESGDHQMEGNPPLFPEHEKAITQQPTAVEPSHPSLARTILLGFFSCLRVAPQDSLE